MREKAIFVQKLPFFCFCSSFERIIHKYVYNTNIQTEECTRPCHL